MLAPVKFKKEVLCMNLAHVVEMAKQNNSVKHLQVRQQLFDRNANTKGVKTQIFRETFAAVLNMNEKEPAEQKIS